MDANSIMLKHSGNQQPNRRHAAKLYLTQALVLFPADSAADGPSGLENELI